MFGKIKKTADVIRKATSGMTRRSFLKGAGSLALSAMTPKIPGITKASSAVPTTAGISKSPPWIQSMVVALRDTPVTKHTWFKTGNDAKIKKIASKSYDTHAGNYKGPLLKGEESMLQVRRTDGEVDNVIMKEDPTEIHIEFDIADDYHNNQHIIINKKTGNTEIIDDNFSMAWGGEDVVKDDPLIWDATNDVIVKEMNTKPALSHYKKNYQQMVKDQYQERLADFSKMPIEKGLDKYSVPDGTYEPFFQNYVDSFSPAGVIFNRKAYNKSKKVKKAEESEALWEEQFRQGHGMHGFNVGGIVNKLKTVGSLTKGLKVQRPVGGISKGFAKLPPPKTGKEKFLETAQIKQVDPITTTVATEEIRAPAMFWKSREEIAEATQDTMRGDQWLGYLKKRGVGDLELKDTSLGFHLTTRSKEKIRRQDLLKDFDLMAPEIDATILGWRDTKSLIRDAGVFVEKALQYPPVYMDIKTRRVMQNIMQTFKRMNLERPTGPQMKALKTTVNKAFKEEFGIDEIIGKGLDPAKRMPFMAKKTALVFDDLLNQKGIQYTVSGKPKHAGDQTMSGGRNYQEILFSYKPGIYRIWGEKPFRGIHEFGGHAPDNMFVWVRISDRTDEHGKKFLYVEEIQSDMHQAARGKKPNLYREGYQPRADFYEPGGGEIKRIQNELNQIQKEIDKAGGINVGPLRVRQEKLFKQGEGLTSEKKRYKSSSKNPEGPTPESKDYGRFVMQYLLRAARESGDYDGIALASAEIKGESKTGFYKKIMIPQMKNIAKKTGAIYDETIFVDEKGIPHDGVPALLLKDKKGIIPTTEKMKGGIPVYRHGGEVRDPLHPFMESLT